ncbi:MAG: bifunctional homocysteine S-methyltransferase/methylenetetrahydrofolate reductase [Pseudomonadota bacterium]
MSRLPFLEFLKQKGVVLFDGAMGTELYRRGHYLNTCYDLLNLTNDKAVKEIYQAYVQAGAQVLTTNTFGANRIKLSGHGAEGELAQINTKSAKLARAACGESGYVAGSIGPLGLRIEPWGPTSVDEAHDMFCEQMYALVEGGIDLFVVETFSDLSEVHQAILAARKVAPNLPVIASMTVDVDGNSLYGTTPEVFAARLDEWGADIIGVNCSVGPGPMLVSLEKMVTATHKPICVQPNAGQPRLHEGRQIYLTSSEYMAEFAKRFVQTGASVIGGCCGTTPEHIKAMRSAIRMQVPGRRAAEEARRIEIEGPREAQEVPMSEKSTFGQKLAEKKFPVSVELTSPRGWDPEKAIAAAKDLYEGGVDCINVPDGPRASCRMSNQALCLLIRQQVGIDVLPHYCCRDRNLLGMMSDLLGLAALGMHNILVITGDPPKMGDYPDATAVFDVDSIGLTNLVKSFNRGIDFGGNPVNPPTKFLIGVGCNPGALDIEGEISRFKWKVDAGAEFAITQPVFDTSKLIEFLELIKGHRIPILAGVWPLTSLRNAEFMNAEVPGASVPDSIIRRMAKAQEKGKEAARAEGVAIARESIRDIYDAIDGLQVSAPFGWISYAFSVLEELADLPIDRALIKK